MSGNKMFSFLKIPLTNSISPCPRGHLMDYYLPNEDNHGHLVNYHLPHFVHVVIEFKEPGASAVLHIRAMGYGQVVI